MDNRQPRLGSGEGVTKIDTLRRAAVDAVFLLTLDTAVFFLEVVFFGSEGFFTFCSLAAGSACCYVSPEVLGRLSSKDTFEEAVPVVFLPVGT